MDFFQCIWLYSVRTEPDCERGNEKHQHHLTQWSRDYKERASLRAQRPSRTPCVRLGDEKHQHHLTQWSRDYKERALLRAQSPTRTPCVRVCVKTPALAAFRWSRFFMNL